MTVIGDQPRVQMLRLQPTGNAFTVGLQAPVALASTQLYNMPPTLPISSQQFLASDASGNMSWQNGGIAAYPSVAANDVNTNFVITDNPFQLGCLPTAQRTYTLPPAVLSAGQQWAFFNNSTTDGNYIIIAASGGGIIDYVIPTQGLVLVPLTSTPTTPADWSIQYAESGFISYTPIFNAFGTVTNVSMFYKRSRGFMTIKGYFVSGVPNNARGRAFTPSVFQINGSLYANTNGVVIGTACATLTSPSTNMYLQYNSPAFPSEFDFTKFSDPTNTSVGANALVNTGDLVQIFLEAPIVGWN